MPENINLQIVLAIAGCISLLIGLFGGGVKAKEITIPKLSFLARLFSSLIGVALIGTAIWLPINGQPSPQPTSSPSVETEPATSVNGAETASVSGVETIPPLPLPTDTPENPLADPTTIRPTDTPRIATPTSEFESPSKWSDFFCLENETCTTADVNGDGKADLIAFVRGTQAGSGYADVWVSLSSGNGFEAASKWSDFFCQTNEICAAADVNDDSRADLIAFVRDTQGETGYADVWVSFSNGTGFETASKWSDFFCQTDEVCAVADVNGDGRADLIAFVRDTQPEPSRYDVWVGLSTGTAFESPTKWNDFFCLENEICTAADANGDGKADLIVFVRDTQPEPGRYDVYVGLSTGDGFAWASKWSDFFCLENEVCTVADVDGDGKADLIAFVRDTQPESGRYDVYVGLSTGQDFASPIKWSDHFCLENEDCIVADVNGDSRADLVSLLRDSQPEPDRYDVYVSLKTQSE